MLSEHLRPFSTMVSSGTSKLLWCPKGYLLLAYQGGKNYTYETIYSIFVTLLKRNQHQYMAEAHTSAT